MKTDKAKIGNKRSIQGTGSKRPKGGEQILKLYLWTVENLNLRKLQIYPVEQRPGLYSEIDMLYIGRAHQNLYLLSGKTAQDFDKTNIGR